MRRMSGYMWHLGSGLQKDLGMTGEIRELALLVCLLSSENCLLFLPFPGFPARGLVWGKGLGEDVVGRSTRLAEAPWLRTTLPVAHYELIFLINPVIILRTEDFLRHNIVQL